MNLLVLFQMIFFFFFFLNITRKAWTSHLAQNFWAKTTPNIDCTFLLRIFAFIEGKQANRMHEFMKHLVLPLMYSCQKKKKNNVSLNFIPRGCFLMVQHAEISFILGVCHLYCVTWAQHPI